MLNVHMQARGQPQNQQAETFHSAAPIYTSNACGETACGRSFKVRHWALWTQWLQLLPWIFSRLLYSAPHSAAVLMTGGTSTRVWRWFNHCRVLTAAPVRLWWELRAPLRLLHTFVCGVSVIQLEWWHTAIANHRIINFRLSWLSSPYFTGRQINLTPSDTVDFRSSEHQLILPPVVTAGDLHVIKLLHPTVFTELGERRGDGEVQGDN